VGATVIIPGFSSGTVLILTRIYEPLLDNVSGLIKSKKGFLDGLIFLAPIALGAILGLLLVAQAFTWLIARFSLPVFVLFAGFILGSIPMVLREIYGRNFFARIRQMRNKANKANYCLDSEPQTVGADGNPPIVNDEQLANEKIPPVGAGIDRPPCTTHANENLTTGNQITLTDNQNPPTTNKPTIRHSSFVIRNSSAKASFCRWHLEPILIAAVLVIGITMLQRFVISAPTATAGDPLTLLSSFAIVLSGILSAAALIIPGLSGALMLILLGQYNTITSAISITNFNFLVLALFAIGILVGFFLSVKLVRFLLKRYRVTMHLAIVGFLIGSIISIFILEETYYSATTPLGIAIAILLFLVGATASYFLGRIGQKKKK